MSLPFVSSRRLSLALLLSTTLLAACGGGDSKDEGAAPQLRVLNLSEVATLDVYLEGARSVSGAAQGQLGSYQSVSTDAIDVELRRGGGDLSLVTEERTFSKDSHYTLLAYGRESALRYVTLPEDEDLDDLTDGKAGLRVFHAGVDVGDLDIYLTTADADLAETVPTQSGLSSGRLSGTKELTPGTYRLRVTGYGDSGDLRMDLPAVTLKADKFATLVLTGGSGGVLVHGGQLEQQAEYLGLPNTKARLRTVAGASSRGVVSASWKGSSIVGGLTSPSVGPYMLVDAGSGALDVRVGGGTVSNATRSLVAGADYTLLVHGSGAVNLISDDNRLPTTGSSRARIRLVHGAPLSDALTLSVDYAVVAADVGLGSSSAFFNIASGEERRLDVTAATAADALYVGEDTRIQSGAVYTVFVLGGATTPTGLLRKDR